MAIVIHTLIVLYFILIIKISEYPDLTINFMTKKTYNSVLLEENKQLRKEVETLKKQLRKKLQNNDTRTTN